MDFENIEKNIKDFYDEFGSKANLEDIERVILKEEGFTIAEQDKFLTFSNQSGEISRPLAPCTKLEVEVYRALKKRNDLPKECLSCKQIFVHPRKSEIPFATVFSALIKAYKKADLPIVGRALRVLPADRPMKERFLLRAYSPKDFIHLLHHTYITLKEAGKYGDTKDTPIFTMRFFPKKGTMIYVRYGCEMIRGLAKQLKCLKHYFDDTRTMYKIVPVSQSEVGYSL